jgi:hypothetical protein
VAKSPKIPPSLDRRPRYRGWVIPYIVVVGSDGTPHFSRNDTGRVNQVAAGRKCGQCGERLRRNITFIGPEDEVRLRKFMEPGMHPECAQYAVATCPWLSSPHYRTKNKEATDPKLIFVGDGLMTQPRPTRMAMYTTTSYRWSRKGLHVIFDVGVSLRIVWF